MTPAEAANVLGVSEGAPAAEIEAAFRRLARQSHPDLFAAESAATVAAAAARFSSVAEAHAVLVAASGVVAQPVVLTPRQSPRLLATWIGLLGVASVLSFTAGALPGSWLDLLGRMIPFGVVLVGYAVTGRRVFFGLAVLFFAVSAVVTLAFASFGSLLAFQVLLAPTLGLWYLGRRRPGGRSRP